MSDSLERRQWIESGWTHSCWFPGRKSWSLGRKTYDATFGSVNFTFTWKNSLQFHATLAFSNWEHGSPPTCNLHFQVEINIATKAINGHFTMDIEFYWILFPDELESRNFHKKIHRDSEFIKKLICAKKTRRCFNTLKMRKARIINCDREWHAKKFSANKAICTGEIIRDESSANNLKGVVVMSSLSRESTICCTCESLSLSLSLSQVSTINWLLIIMHASYVDIFCPRWVGNHPMSQAFSIVRRTLISVKNRPIGYDWFIYFQQRNKLWPWIDITVKLSAIEMQSLGLEKRKWKYEHFRVISTNCRI